jgi:hypothetical protein
MYVAVAIVIIAFIILPLPTLVIYVLVYTNVIDLENYEQILVDDLIALSRMALALNSAINPAIYGICAKPFRDSIKRAVTCK